MESQLNPPRISCPTHPNEPVLKVSLDPKDKQLLFCYECLQPNHKSSLVKYQDFIETLYQKYSELASSSIETNLPPDAKQFLSQQDQSLVNFSRQIKNQKQIAANEIKKIEKQIPEVLQAVRASSQERLDKFENCVKAAFDNYSQKITECKELIAKFSKDTPTQSSLNKRIFETESTEEAENNLRGVLKELETVKAIKGGDAFESLEKIQNKLESLAENRFIVPEKREKEYAGQIQLLLGFFEALLSSFKEETTEDINKEKEKDKPQEISELDRQKKISETLYKGLDDLDKVLETSAENIEKALEKKFTVEITSYECPTSKNGLTPVEGRAYRCLTCMSKYNDLDSSDLICDDCRNACHKGHKVEYVSSSSFLCMCQFVMRDCQLATDCHYRFTNSNSYRMATWKCNVCEMSSSRVLCMYCAQQCHGIHGTSYNGISNTYCDCRGLFDFCKYHTNTPANPS